MSAGSWCVAHPGHGEEVAEAGLVEVGWWPLTMITTDNESFAATAKPRKKMDVLEFEIGVEIGSRAFEGTYESSVEKALASAKTLVANLDRRFLHSAGVKHRLGAIVVRHDPKTDPLRDAMANNGAEGLAAFRDYWNGNPREVGDSHDLAVAHVFSAPSGIAYVDTVGERGRYAISCGRGATSWADGTIAHEFGHSWNLHHNNDSGLFYEARPRQRDGASLAGGNNWHVSIMNGKGQHNIGRVSTEEAEVVWKAREKARPFGDAVKEPGPIRPFGAYDKATCERGGSVTIDVVANDFDCNNDPLDVRLLDSVSHQGGTIALSSGTGPGGRNELTYKAPTDIAGEDFFHYTVFDESGRSDWGAVYVTAK